MQFSPIEQRFLLPPSPKVGSSPEVFRQDLALQDGLLDDGNAAFGGDAAVVKDSAGGKADLE